MLRCCHCGFEEQSDEARFCRICGNLLNSTEKKLKVHSKEELIEVIDNYVETARIQNKSILDLNSIDVSELTDLSNVFKWQKPFYGDYDVSQWDVSNVKKMDQTFYCSSFKGDLSSWDVSNVRSMSQMFHNSQNMITGLENWNVSNVRNMDYMFESNRFFNENIGNWDVSNVKTMKGMFKNSRFNRDISKWDVSGVEDMSEMFEDCFFGGNIDNWNVSNVINLSRMFYHNYGYKGDFSKWNLKHVIKIEDFGFYKTLAGERSIKINGWEEQLKKRTITNLDSIEDLKKLKNIVLIKGIEPQLV